VVWYQAQDGTSYEQRSIKASTLVGVAGIIKDLRQQGHELRYWERHTIEDPDVAEKKTLAAFLAIMKK